MHKSVARSQLNTRKPAAAGEGGDGEPDNEYYSAQLQDGYLPAPLTVAEKQKRSLLVRNIEVLESDRRKTSQQAREEALTSLLRAATLSNGPCLIGYTLFCSVAQAFETARSDAEAASALQLVCVVVFSLPALDDRKDECLDVAQRACGAALQQIASGDGAERSVETQQSIVTAFACVFYYLNAGGGGFGVEALVGRVLEIAEAQSGASSNVGGAAVGGAALLATLASGATGAAIANMWFYSLVPMLDSTHLPTKLAAAKLLAVIVERSDVDALLAEQDNVDALEDILATLRAQTRDTKAASKRERKLQNLLFKSVLQFVEARLGDRLPSEEAFNRDENYEELVSQFHKNTTKKSLGISSWSALIVVEHLTWVFGPSLQRQLAINTDLRRLLKLEHITVKSSWTEGDDDVADADDFNENDAGHQPQEPARVSQITRSKNIRKEQVRKAEENGLNM